MSKFEDLSRELIKGGKAGEVRKVVNSEEGRKIGRMVDGNALKKAVEEGDSGTVNKIVGQFLSTDEGKALAKKLGESFGVK